MSAKSAIRSVMVSAVLGALLAAVLATGGMDADRAVGWGFALKWFLIVMFLLTDE